MAKIFDRVKVSTATTGQGSVTFGPKLSSVFYTPAEAGAADGDDVEYLLTEGTDEEHGLGTIGGGTTTMSRDTVFKSSIAGVVGTAKMSLAGGATLTLVASAHAFRSLRAHRTVTGATDTIANGDGGGLIAYNSAAAVAVSIAQVAAAGAFLKGWKTYIKNIGAGDVTITPATSTIEGAATLVVKQNHAAMVYSDGTNFRVLRMSATPPALANANLSDLTDITKARQNLRVEPTASQNVDLNTIVTPGSYWISNSSTNTPTPDILSFFWLEVIGVASVNNTLTQRATSISIPGFNTASVTYQRMCLGGTWTPWRRYTFADGFDLVFRRFTASGTYVPTAGLLYALAEGVGAGAGGGGSVGNSGSYYSGGGGGGGGWGAKRLLPADIGSGLAVQIGAGGLGQMAANGLDGGDTNLGGTLLIAKGGKGGLYGSTSQLGIGGAGGGFGTGDDMGNGYPGDAGFFSQGSYLQIIPAGVGGGSRFSGGAQAPGFTVGNAQNGNNALANTGGGGSGGASSNTGSNSKGGDGGSGLLVIREFIQRVAI